MINALTILVFYWLDNVNEYTPTDLVRQISFVYIIMTLVFLADLVANFVVFTLKEIFLRKKILFLEVGLQILSVFALISEFVPGVIDNYDGVKLY